LCREGQDLSSTETDQSAEHKRLVKALIEKLKNQGLEILKAASEGFEPCPEVEGYCPDVYAFNRKKEFVVFGLAKTCSELDSVQIGREFKIFAGRFMHKGKARGKAVPLCIAITRGCENQLDTLLVKLKLDQKKNVFKYAF
jgi:hypothetical protein